MDEGTIIMSGLDKERIIESIKVISETRQANIVNDYDVDNVSDKVLKIILSYTDYVNRTVWYKVKMLKNPRVLVLGSAGMVGHQLCNYIISKSNFILFDISKKLKYRKETNLIDVKNELQISEYILNLSNQTT